MAEDFASASLIDNVRFNEAVIVANALQGIFRRRRKAVAAANLINVDGQAVGLLSGFKKKTRGRPIWVRVVKDPALLLLDVEDVRRALEGSPHPFASDPAAKKAGMAHFQPHALTISRGDLWKERRAFTEQILLRSRDLADRFVAVVREEIGVALDAGPLDYEAMHGAYRRLTRRVVLGDQARDDAEISDLLATLMEQANGMPGTRSTEFEPFTAKLREYLAAAPEGSLTGLAAQVEAGHDVHPDGQIPHWLFATQDTLSANALRAAALLASHDADADPQATLLEALRLWPTTPLLSRVTLADVTWHGVRVPAGTNILICNTFMHRDRERLGDSADRFTPEGWADGGRFSDDWGLNFFSHGPQGCPGSNLALLLGTTTLETIRERGTPTLERPALDPAKPLPHMLDVFGVRVAVA